MRRHRDASSLQRPLDSSPEAIAFQKSWMPIARERAWYKLGNKGGRRIETQIVARGPSNLTVDITYRTIGGPLGWLAGIGPARYHTVRVDSWVDAGGSHSKAQAPRRVRQPSPGSRSR